MIEPKHTRWTFLGLFCLLLFILSCSEKGSKKSFKALTISPKPENLQSPQKIRKIENQEWRETVAKSFEVDSGEYKELIARYGKDIADRKAFTKSHIDFVEIEKRNLHVLDYYYLSEAEIHNDTLLLNFGAKYFLGGTSFGFTITGGKFKGNFGHTLRCMTDKAPNVIVQYDSLSLNRRSYEKGDTIYGEYFIKALNKTDEIEFLSKGMFRSIIE